MKATSSAGPSREQIAAVTGASSVLRGSDDEHRQRGNLDDDMLGDHSALFELLR